MKSVSHTLYLNCHITNRSDNSQISDNIKNKYSPTPKCVGLVVSASFSACLCSLSVGAIDITFVNISGVSFYTLYYMRHACVHVCMHTLESIVIIACRNCLGFNATARKPICTCCDRLRDKNVTC